MASPMADQETTWLLGSTYRFLNEFPDAKRLVNLIWVNEAITPALRFELILYAFYHCGVHVLDAWTAECAAFYNYWNHQGTRAFMAHYVCPLFAGILNSHEALKLSSFVEYIIERQTRYLDCKKKTHCTMLSCMCHAVIQELPSPSDNNETLSQTQTEIIYETPKKEMEHGSRTKRRKTTETFKQTNAFIEFADGYVTEDE